MKSLAAQHLRDYAFKLRPISMSADLIQQLKACSVKLGVCAETLQKKINNKCDKNKHYAAVIAEANHSKFKTSQEIGFNFNFNASVHPSSVGSFVPIYFAVLRPQSSFPLNPLLLAFSVGAQVNQLTEIARERIELAKALIKAVDKPKAKAKAAPGPTPDATKGTGDQGEASA